MSGRPRPGIVRAARQLVFALLAAVVAIGCLAAPAARAAATAPAVLVIPVEGAIGPAVSDFVRRGLERAAGEGAQLVVLRLDTPGGLDTSMRAIVKAILASPVPVAAWVGPNGARAASAGTFVLYASHFAAMAPATNLGAASPVSIGAPGGDEGGDGRSDKDRASGKKSDDGDKRQARDRGTGKGDAGGGGVLLRKQTHDASAYIRGLAQLRHRNAEWAERAVREAVSLSAEEALKIKVIDLVAEDVPALLTRLDGRVVEVSGEKRTLRTAGATVVVSEPDWRTRVLGIITDPSIAYILMMIGIYAILFEFSSPGMVLPGVVGAICVLLALYAFHLLPVNYAGLALIVLGIGFMTAELFVPSYGSLGIGGLIALVTGSLILFDAGGIPGFSIPYPVIGAVAATTAAFLLLAVGMVLKARKRPVVTGREELIGARGEVLADFERSGWARVHGETWQVRSQAAIRAGTPVRVVGIDGLVLEVAPENGRPQGGS